MGKPLRSIAFLITLFILSHSLAWSATPKPRPLAGIGLLTLQVKSAASSITLYREPGIGRLTELQFSEFPSMSPAVKNQAERHHVAVTRTKGEWLKVIFDDSGREGWIEQNRGWEFCTWERCLKGREINLLNGIRKEFYQLKSAPSSASQTIETVSREKKLRVVEVENSWMLVLVDYAHSGWLRWKDDDGRLLISVTP